MKKLILAIGVLLLAALAASGCAGKLLSMQPLNPPEVSTHTSPSPTVVEVEERNESRGSLHLEPAPSTPAGDRLYVLNAPGGREKLAVVDTAGILHAESVLDEATPSAPPTSVPNAPPDSCPVTQPQDPAFTPPPPYPAEAPYAGEFWYGTEALWTMLRVDGRWWHLPHNETGYTQKVFWWREGYVWTEEPQPDLTVSGRRLDAPAPPLLASRATNAFHPDFGSAMLVGVDIPTLGCWEITGHYGGHELSFVVWVAP